MKHTFFMMLIVAIAGCGETASSGGNAADKAGNSNSVARDNTGVNVRDREATSVTPADQKENQTDIKLTSEIRKRIVGSKMSIDAQNAKIVTQDGKVTLRGPVKTAAEKAQIEQVAADIAGAQNVDSQLEIQP
jgi:hyperosmotically inducible periplasmic protein